MRKALRVVLAAMLSLGGLLSLTPAAFSEAAALVVDAGNTACPVSGDKISGKHFVEYNGKHYGLCCAHCKKEFDKDPAKYIAALESGAAATHEGHSH